MKTIFSTVFFPMILFMLTQPGYTQKSVRTTGKAQMELTEDLSRLQVKNKLTELATIDALEKAFGRVVIQGNATYISNLQTGQEVQTNTVFNTIANTSVKGEVEKIINTQFTDIEGFKTVDGKKEKVTEILCEIEILAREIITPPISFTCFPVGCLDEKCRTTKFRNNDRFYLFFSTPMSGYLTIYLDQQNSTQCLYPDYYMSTQYQFEGGVPVEPNKKYFVFKDSDYYMNTDRTQEMNRLFIIFSKTPLNKPALSEATDLDKVYKLPESLSSEDFQRWLNTYRSSGMGDVQVSIIDITITK